MHRSRVFNIDVLRGAHVDAAFHRSAQFPDALLRIAVENR
jgi:hypothetical protein